MTLKQARAVHYEADAELQPLTPPPKPLNATSFRVEDSGFKGQGSGFRVQGSRVRVQGSRLRVQELGFQGSGFRGYA